MKRFTLLFLFLLPAFCSHVYPTIIISQSKAWQIVKSQVLQDDTTNVNVYVSNHMIDAGTIIKALFKDEHSPNYTSWLFFIDDAPYSSWEHPCRYVFVDVNNGSITTKRNTRPPYLNDYSCLVWQTLPNVSALRKEPHERSQSTLVTASHDYAVIINGGGNKEINHERYWNNCSALYSTLINKYGYLRDHIYVIMADGTDPTKDTRLSDGSFRSQKLDLDNDGTNDIQYAATKQNNSTVFNTLHNCVNNNENLFVYVTDHGGYNNGTYNMALWNNDEMTASEFNTELNKVNAANINVCLTFCYSGGFISDIQASNRVITTACKFNEFAHSSSSHVYGEFSKHWISAFAGEELEADTIVVVDNNCDGIISMEEAYNYVSAHDQYTSPIYTPLNYDTTENPQFLSNPTNLGTSLSLNCIFKGTYYNGSSTSSINLPNPLYTNCGGFVIINSPFIKGATVTYQGTTPSYWLCNTTTGSLKVDFPSSGGTTIVRIQKNGNDHYLPIISTSNPYILSIRVTNGVIEVNLLIEESERNQSELEKTYSQSTSQDNVWVIDVYNAIAGEKVFSQNITGVSSSIDTCGWEPGVYVIRATIGDVVLLDKVFIK